MSAGEGETVPRPVLDGRVISPGGAAARSDTEEGAEAHRMEMFVVEEPIRRQADLVVPDASMAQLRSLLAKIRYHHVLYGEFGLAQVDPYGGRTAINLYGPPGTGKSFAADAIAAELEMGIIRANYAEIESKFVGETAKNIKAAFRKARETGALLFFDEADSILGRRLTNVAQSTDHAVNVSRSVMLLELDRFDGVAVFATNLASNYDTAFVRRILGHVELPLPDAAQRRRLFGRLIPARLPARLSEADMARLIEESEGLSGGDLLNVVITAASAAIEREGPGCTVTPEDFQAAIVGAHRARAAIGRP